MNHFFSFSRSNEVPDCLSDPNVLSIADKLSKTPAQILLRFLIQRGIAVVPKSSSKERIHENFEVRKFLLICRQNQIKYYRKFFIFLGTTFLTR